jgi:hypothetical protein
MNSATSSGGIPPRAVERDQVVGLASAEVRLQQNHRRAVLLTATCSPEGFIEKRARMAFGPERD